VGPSVDSNSEAELNDVMRRLPAPARCTSSLLFSTHQHMGQFRYLFWFDHPLCIWTGVLEQFDSVRHASDCGCTFYRTANLKIFALRITQKKSCVIFLIMWNKRSYIAQLRRNFSATKVQLGLVRHFRFPQNEAWFGAQRRWPRLIWTALTLE
jgi:hypothetical protein